MSCMLAHTAFLQCTCRTLIDYFLRYHGLDCRLFADMFQYFRSSTTKHTCRDPANYISLPQLTFAAAFRTCKVDLLQDVEMCEFFDNGIRGGMTFVNEHHVNSDNNTSIAYWNEHT